MAASVRLLRASHRTAAALALGVCLAMLVAACGSDEGCEFHFDVDAVSYDDIPWICASGTRLPLLVLFRPDGTGALDRLDEFTWQVTSCRSTRLLLDDGRDLDLLEVGGNVAVGRLTFVLEGDTFLCGYGVPPP
jgi:hypothetical protein